MKHICKRCAILIACEDVKLEYNESRTQQQCDICGNLIWQGVIRFYIKVYTISTDEFEQLLSLCRVHRWREEVGSSV